MDREINFEALAETLNVQQSVLELLYELVPYKDSFQFLTNTTRKNEFWNLIDECLPSHISLKLHAADAIIPCDDRDFPPDTLSPVFQDFWAALNISQNSQPVYFQNQYAFTRFKPEHINELIENINGTWTRSDDGEKWILLDHEFSINSLCLMCDSYIDNARPWIFCDVDEIRSAYLECDKILNKVDKSVDTSAIYSKMRQFGFTNNEDFAKVAKGFTMSYNVSKFALQQDLMEALSSFLTEANNFFRGTNRNIPKIDMIDAWTTSRAENLVQQMEKPFEQRGAYVSTPQILQARSGQPVDQPFEKNSVAELLLSNCNEDVMPFPYTSGRAEIQSGSSVPFVHDAFRKFVARLLMNSGYTATSDSVVDILADVAQIIAKKIAQDATAIKKGSTASARDIMIQALNTNEFDIQKMMATPRLSK
ncbi:hypothetical protein TRFO_29235 [Tritrichomonas foetus]|uniref:Uncharacterized protein n=1 Tax=Tritrichomonas foetus TaxID=1144522 RepID=A0A1J4K0V3_9EUKA|nr:hypothetical protein TRFO_29235 [Tritrichomonas foetus]|eukprot:OHT03372.1 hypothetical protein TRFO_29235 [Tritrichomonas foetus]